MWSEGAVGLCAWNVLPLAIHRLELLSGEFAAGPFALFDLFRDPQIPIPNALFSAWLLPNGWAFSWKATVGAGDFRSERH